MFQHKHGLRRMGVAAAAAVALTAAGCGASSSTGPSAGGKPVKGGVITLSNVSGAGANWIFPFGSSAYYSVVNYEYFMYLMNRPLYMFGDNGSSILVNYGQSPADQPVYSNGGRTVTITMKGWKWSNGESVDAKDVIFWLNMDEAEKTSFAGYSPGGIPDNLVSYRATGANTLVLNLNKAYSSLWFTYNELAVVNPFPMAWDITKLGAAPGSGGCTTDTKADGWAKCKAVYNFLTAQAKDTGSYAQPGSIWQIVDGPFRLSSYNTNGNYTFVPNPKYSGPQKPYISQLKFVAYTSDTAIYTALKTGTLSIGAIPAADLPTKPTTQVLPSANPLASAGYSLQPAYAFGISYFYLNFNNPTIGPVFKQLYFRQALQELIDQEGITRTINRGYGYPTTAAVPVKPTSQWVSSEMTANGGDGPYPYSVAKAQATLAAHGWAKVGGVLTCQKAGTGTGECGAGIAKGTQAKFNMDYTSGFQAQASSVAVMKSDMSLAGIQISTSAKTFTAVLAESVPCSGKACTFQMLYISGWDFNGPGFEPTGEPIIQTGAGSNSGSYSNPTMDKLINETHTSSSIAVFHQYANYTATQLPLMWVPEIYAIIAVSNKVHNVQQNPLAMIYPEYWYYTK